MMSRALSRGSGGEGIRATIVASEIIIDTAKPTTTIWVVSEASSSGVISPKPIINPTDPARSDSRATLRRATRLREL